MLTLETFIKNWEKKFPALSLKKSNFIIAVSGGVIVYWRGEPGAWVLEAGGADAGEVCGGSVPEGRASVSDRGQGEVE